MLTEGAVDLGVVGQSAGTLAKGNTTVPGSAVVVHHQLRIGDRLLPSPAHFFQPFRDRFSHHDGAVHRDDELGQLRNRSSPGIAGKHHGSGVDVPLV
ncbi:hypothetical protein D3C80_1797040 [compost metagenome]